MPANLENSAVATGQEKVSFHSNSKEGQFKECSYYHTIALISHTDQEMLKILQARLQQYVNQELADVQAGFRKGRGTRDQIANICWILEKARNSRKISASASLTMLKPLTVWITANWGKSFRRWEYQTTLPASWEICMEVKKQWLESDMEQQTGSKSGKEYVKAIDCHPDYLTFMQSTSWEMPGWMKHKLESRLLGEISTTSDNLCRKRRGTKETFDERGEWKSWLITQHSKNKVPGIQSHHFMANRWRNNRNSDRLYFLGLQNHCKWWLQPWN